MKLDELKDRLAIKPFRPFTIETTSGQPAFEITGEENIFLPIQKPDIAVVFVDSHMYIIDIAAINVLAVK